MYTQLNTHFGGIEMLNAQFGIEVEFTGITRKDAAQKVADFLGGRVESRATYNTSYKVIAPDGRVWQFVYDGSLKSQKKINGLKQNADSDYSVEMVSPILKYEQDISDLQDIIRILRKGGAFTNSTMGVHIHLNGADHTPRTIRNFINIIASKNDLFYKALQIKPERARFCKRMDETLVTEMNKSKPKTFEKIEGIWYKGYNGSRDAHYHNSRYHFLNLHSFFHGCGTVELRGFNSELHAGKIRSYIVLALALNNQALTQKSASSKKPQIENEKFAMRTYLNRIGFIGEDFKNCREHLTKHLNGCSGWRYGTPNS